MQLSALSTLDGRIRISMTIRFGGLSLYSRVVKARNYEGSVASGQTLSHKSNLF
jgi:hypothetical protein